MEGKKKMLTKCKLRFILYRCKGEPPAKEKEREKKSPKREREKEKSPRKISQSLNYTIESRALSTGRGTGYRIRKPDSLAFTPVCRVLVRS